VKGASFLQRIEMGMSVGTIKFFFNIFFSSLSLILLRLNSVNSLVKLWFSTKGL